MIVLKWRLEGRGTDWMGEMSRYKTADSERAIT